MEATTYFKVDASGRSRVSTLSTLFDGKCLYEFDENLLSKAGTGTYSFNDNTHSLAVDSGEYMVLQSKHVCEYFSGKSTLVETTFDSFAPQVGVVKRVGYFTSSTVAPFDTGLDGFFIESNESGVYLKVYNNGVLKESIPFEKWDSYNELKDYDWNKFTIVAFDFLWLGGSELRVFLKTRDAFKLAVVYKHASLRQGAFIKSPQQHVRYEISSTNGVGVFNPICSVVMSEGAIPDKGRVLCVTSGVFPTNSISTVYPIKAVKQRDDKTLLSVKVISGGVVNTSTNELGTVLLLLNPTFSAEPVWTQAKYIESGEPLSGSTITNLGTIIGVFPSRESGVIPSDYASLLNKLGTTIDGVNDVIALAYKPSTNNQSVLGHLTIGVV